jgi:protein-S-isoprenylcysteine O-methyltransferase Ste14
MDLFLISTFLVQGSVFFLIAAVVCVAGTHFQILQEEAFLTREYGSAYARYKTLIPRYLGIPRGADHTLQETSP